jgi:hypothetical protein
MSLITSANSEARLYEYLSTKEEALDVASCPLPSRQKEVIGEFFFEAIALKSSRPHAVRSRALSTRHRLAVPSKLRQPLRMVHVSV